MTKSDAIIITSTESPELGSLEAKAHKKLSGPRDSLWRQPLIEAVFISIFVLGLFYSFGSILGGLIWLAETSSLRLLRYKEMPSAGALFLAGAEQKGRDYIAGHLRNIPPE